MFALGSLAHGGFSPLVSDTDIALILDQVSTTTESDIDTINHLVRERHPGSFPSVCRSSGRIGTGCATAEVLSDGYPR